MIVAFLDEENGMEQIGDLREIDLTGAGFSSAFSNLLDAMATDPDWAPVLPGFIAQLTSEGSTGSASVSVGYGWFSQDGLTWARIDSTGPLDGGEFAAIIAGGDGFVATASNTYKPEYLPADLRHLAEGFGNTIVWESEDGTTWTEASGLTSTHGTNDMMLAEWRGDVVELVGWVYSIDEDMQPMTLAGPQQVLADIPTHGLWLDISEFGLTGTPSSGWWGPDATELLFSVDGTSWNRWEPVEFDIGSDPSTGERRGSVRIVGIGQEFIVVEHEKWDDDVQVTIRTLWVGTIE
jgi:hypothetical protein